MSHFYTPWKREKKPVVSDVFRGYRDVPLDLNGWKAKFGDDS